MTGTPNSGSVELADEQPASAVFHAVLQDTASAFPEVLSSSRIPTEAGAFRKKYGDAATRFEAARLTSRQRRDIARHAVAGLSDHLVWRSATETNLLCDVLAGDSATPLALESHSFSGQPGWEPMVVYRGERWAAERLPELGQTLVSRRVATAAAGAALGWVADNVLENGVLRLSGRKVAILGGGAEMSPTRFWLEAGADVLWIDVVPPPQEWFDLPGMAGRLFWSANNADLLTDTRAILSTLIGFADNDPLDLGLYAYAPGRARELRLTGAMNALVDALPHELVASVTILRSPTTPTELSVQDQEVMQERFAEKPMWQSLLHGCRLLGQGGGAVSADGVAVARSVATIQGTSYQAAQYLGKVLTAETWANQADPLRVSANTAAITRTRSMEHPVFAAAFAGASAFDVETMTPRQSRRLNGLLSIHDWMHPDPPEPGKVRIHGAIDTLPFPLEEALRTAALIGFARSPRLLRGLISR